jgi:hypothetical protein
MVQKQSLASSLGFNGLAEWQFVDLI